MKGKEETILQTLIFKRTKCFKFAETDGANKVEKSVTQSLTQKVDYREKNEASK